MNCPHCNAGVLHFKGGKAKLRTNILVVHKSGVLETNCPSCKKPIELPGTLDMGRPLKKAARGRFAVPLDRANKPPA